MNMDEKLDLILNQLSGLKEDVGGLKEDVSSLNKRMDGIEQRMDSMEQRMDGIEQRMDGIEGQIKKTERRLSHKIDDSESAILDEVERVHEILDKHIHDKTRHTA